jgi:hypothetical protein
MYPFKRCVSPVIDLLRTELLQAGGGPAFRDSLHKLIASICNKGIITTEKGKSLIAHICEVGETTGSSNFREVSLLSFLLKFYSLVFWHLYDHSCINYW